jgi:transcriptional regulator with XRE-family HTH domain
MEPIFNKDIIGKRILNERKEHGLSQSEVAKKAGITPAALSQIEKGTRTPTTPVLYRIANALGVSMDYLAGSADKSDLYDLLQNEQIKMFYKGFQSLDSSDKELIMKNIEFLKSKK